MSSCRHLATEQNSSRPVEDKTTYRVTRIPGVFDEDQLLQAITEVLGLEDPTGTNIHSLAFDIPDGVAQLWKAATVTFRVRPTRLSPSSKNEWDFKLASKDGDQNKEQRIYFDTHFLGFTPLSPVAGENGHSIEYVYCSFPAILLLSIQAVL